MTDIVQPGAVVESDAVHHESVTIPTTNRVAEPRRVQRVPGRMLAAVHENLPELRVVFEEEEDVRRLASLDVGYVAAGAIRPPHSAIIAIS